MSTTVTFSGGRYEVPDVTEIRAVSQFLQWDERAANVFADDPLAWFGLLRAVAEFLHGPDEPLFFGGLVGTFEALIEEITDGYLGDDEPEDDDEEEDR